MARGTVWAEDGGVFLDLKDEAPEKVMPVARRSFEEAIEERDLSRVARDALRLMELGVRPMDLIADAAEQAGAPDDYVSALRTRPSSKSV